MEMLKVVDGFNKSQIDAFVGGRTSFEVNGLRGQFNDAIKYVETVIESKGLRCRVESDLKSTAAAGGAAGVALGIMAAPAVVAAGVLGVAAGIGHKLMTRNPDYLILKDYVNFKLTVEYKK
jgi:uncharacterized protein YjlB